jgi:hypothetical protein
VRFDAIWDAVRSKHLCIGVVDCRDRLRKPVKQFLRRVRYYYYLNIATVSGAALSKLTT